VKDTNPLVGIILPTELDHLDQPGFGGTPFDEALVNKAGLTSLNHGLDQGKIIGFIERKHWCRNAQYGSETKSIATILHLHPVKIEYILLPRLHTSIFSFKGLLSYSSGERH
jgi:hypothetical protein